MAHGWCVQDDTATCGNDLQTTRQGGNNPGFPADECPDAFPVEELLQSLSSLGFYQEIGVDKLKTQPVSEQSADRAFAAAGHPDQDEVLTKIHAIIIQEKRYVFFMMIAETFTAMNLSEATMAALRRSNITTPTPIQAQTILPMLDWYDIIGKAPTGTGKTLAFGIPIIEHLDLAIQHPQALILAPTRELAVQIVDELQNLAADTPHIRVAAIYGGTNIDRQIQELKKQPQVLVATPGRLIDHLNRRTVFLDKIQTVVLDEADRMLDMGFVRDVRKILDKMPKVGQIAMFSATMSRAVMDISWIYQRDPVEVTVYEDEANKPPITQYQIELGGHARVEMIAKLVARHQYEKVMVFCNTKHMVQGVTKRLNQVGCKADCIHGDIRQSTREKVLADFRKGHLPVIVATDVAARGIDIYGVDAVINYDVPFENENYLHRIGRTGRAHHPGVAYTFYSFLEKIRLDEIVRFTKTPLTDLSADDYLNR